MADKIKIGDEVMVDGQRCKVIKFGEKSDSVIVKAIDPPTHGRRLEIAVLLPEGLKKAKP